MSKTPTPCNQDIFQNGSPLMAVYTGAPGGAQIFEAWVQDLARRSGQPIDWHYSGGIAQVLYLGDRAEIDKVLYEVPLPNQLPLGAGSEPDATPPMQVITLYEEGAVGRFRLGVHQLPEGTVGYI